MGVYGLHVCYTPQLSLTKQLRGAEGNCHYLDMHTYVYLYIHINIHKMHHINMENNNKN